MKMINICLDDFIYIWLWWGAIPYILVYGYTLRTTTTRSLTFQQVVGVAPNSKLQL